ncbi:hypothetical protein ACEPPN_005712 [Leptodophora sp. 'Broadleaf-Isolate-01']
MAPYTIKCNFQLGDGKKVALVWDGQERLIECTGVKCKARFKVCFDNEEHFRVDDEKSFGNITYTISIKRTEHSMYIIAKEILEPQPESTTVVSQAWTPVECTSGKCEARFGLCFDNEDLFVNDENSFGDITYTISIKCTKHGISIIPKEILEPRPLCLILITPEGESLEEDLAAGRRELPPPPAEAQNTVPSG